MSNVQKKWTTHSRVPRGSKLRWDVVYPGINLNRVGREALPAVLASKFRVYFVPTELTARPPRMKWTTR